MTTAPQEESIYTLQRRIGTMRHLPDPRLEPENEQAPPPASQPRRTSALGKLFAWRVRSDHARAATPA